MWFVWGLITFLIITFSTSQIISYLVCFNRYPELGEIILKNNKSKVILSCLFHVVINIGWIIVVCTVKTISRYYGVIIVVAIIALIFAISVVKHDDSLYQNFKNLSEQ